MTKAQVYLNLNLTAGRNGRYDGTLLVAEGLRSEAQVLGSLAIDEAMALARKVVAAHEAEGFFFEGILHT